MEKGYSQTSYYSVKDKNSTFALWKLTDISGEIFLKGQNRSQNIARASFKDLQKSSVISGGLLANIKSYIWAPTFMILDISGEYNPEFNKDIYIVIPDKAEVRTLNRLNIRATFFSSKPLTLSTFINFNNLYQNRENLSNIKTNSKSWGGFYNYNNIILPQTVNFTSTQWEQHETQTNRNYYFAQTFFQASTSRSFTKFNDKNILSFSRNEYNSKLFETNTFSKVNEIKLNSNINFDSERNYRLISFLTRDNQKGTHINQKRQLIYENIFVNLPGHLDLTGTYNYNNTLYDTIRNVHNNVAGTLKHKLYQSLFSGIYFEYNNVKSNYFKESRSKAGIDFKYIKKIPLNGYLRLNYNYYKQFNIIRAEDITLQVVREEHVLSDGLIVLLGKAYINTASVVVTDITETLIFQAGTDYNLIAHNNYIEIIRIPGGMITNNSTVYVSYSATQPGSYNYNINYQMFISSIDLWKSLFGIYYKRIHQNYSNLSKTDYLALNYIVQNIMGMKLQFESVTTGIEYDYYNSTIVPYKMFKYYVDFHQNFKNKLTVNIEANIRDYKMLEDSSQNRFYDASGKLTYFIKSLTNVSAYGSYFKQEYSGTDLSVIIFGAELTSVYKKLFFSFGIDFYKRNNSDEEIYLKGIYVKITRKF